MTRKIHFFLLVSNSQNYLFEKAKKFSATHFRPQLTGFGKEINYLTTEIFVGEGHI